MTTRQTTLKQTKTTANQTLIGEDESQVMQEPTSSNNGKGITENEKIHQEIQVPGIIEPIGQKNNEEMDIAETENDDLDTSELKDDKWNEDDVSLGKQIRENDTYEQGFKLVTRRHRKMTSGKNYAPKIKYKVTFEGAGILEYLGNENAIHREIKRCKEYIYYKEAYVNSRSNLVIITDRQEDDRAMRANNWPKNAFGEGIRIRELSEKHSLAIKGVGIDVKLTDEILETLYNEHGVIQAFRINLKRDDQIFPSTTIKIETENLADYHRILNRGLYIYNKLYKSTPWEYEPTRCFNCQRFGHKSEDCKSLTTCPVCGETTKDAAQNQQTSTNATIVRGDTQHGQKCVKNILR